MNALFDTLLVQLQSKSKYYIMHSTLFCAGWLILLIIGDFSDESVTYSERRRYRHAGPKWTEGKNAQANGKWSWSVIMEIFGQVPDPQWAGISPTQD